METCPHLRPLVHDISLVLSSYYTKERTGWLQLIPTNVIHKFKYTASVADISLLHNLAIPDTPSFRTVTHFTVGSLFSMDEISVILSLPCLTHLALEYITSFDGDVDPALARASPIKHLTLTSQINCWCPGAFRVFVALAPRLESFTTNGPFHDQRYASWRDEMEAEVVRHGRTLRTLIIDARKMETPPSTPFLDALVEDNASLVRLRIFPGAYTDLLFTRLPETLEVLEVDLALHGAGVPVCVPAPERYAVHKLIVSRVRPLRDAKIPKDLLQASELFVALARQRPYELVEAWREAQARGPKWRDHMALAQELLTPEARTALSSAFGTDLAGRATARSWAGAALTAGPRPAEDEDAPDPGGLPTP